MKERFQPPAHHPPDSAAKKVLYGLRLAVDFQFNTIHRALARVLPGLAGRVLDVGAGNRPFKHLLRPGRTEYAALDFYGAEDFGYHTQDLVRFDGKCLPIDTESVDYVICTEVLEHVEDPVGLIVEMHRVLKAGGRGVVTVPWSARYHYIPFDYHRFTPSRCRSMFGSFGSVVVEERGTDITVIVSKIVVAYARLLMPRRRAWLVLSVVPALVFAPMVGLGILIGHLSILFNVGSPDDPLGYTIWIEK